MRMSLISRCCMCFFAFCLFAATLGNVRAADLHTSVHAGFGTIGNPPLFSTPGYERTYMGALEVVTDMEFCIIRTHDCTLFGGPYAKFSLLNVLRDPVARIGGGGMLGVSVSSHLDLIVGVGLGYMSGHLEPDSRFLRKPYQSLATYDVNFLARYWLSSKKDWAFEAGISHYSNGEPHHINFFGEHGNSSNVGMNMFFTGIGLRW